MQEYNFIPALCLKPKQFWEKVRKLALESEADEILCYMYLMIKEADHKHIPIKIQDIRNFGKAITMFQGVDEWFERINKFAGDIGIELEHYIISSGLKEMIEGTSIARKFKKIYASSFMYDHNNVACWAGQSVNYTTKTQYIFRINKGALDVNDKAGVNRFVLEKDRAVPFDKMIYIGDGDTDVPCMRLVKEKGGFSIAVYPPHKKGAREKIAHLIDDGRVNAVLPARYDEGSAIEKFVQIALQKMHADIALDRIRHDIP